MKNKTSESPAAPKLRAQKYWVYTTVYNCPLCGWEKSYRERRYTPKPENWQERIEFIPEAYHCGY